MILKKIKIISGCCLTVLIIAIVFAYMSENSFARKGSGDENYIDDRYLRLYEYIDKHKQSPVDLFRNAFAKHNIVVVGETHYYDYREFIIKSFKDISGFVEYFGAEIDIEYGDGPERILNYDKYLADAPEARINNGELAMLKAAIDAGLKIVCLRGDNEIDTKNNLVKFKNKKILVWYGAHHVARYDRGLSRVPFFRQLINDKNLPRPYNILLLTMFDSDGLGNAVLFYSNFRNITMALTNLNKIPENLYNYNMNIKEVFMNFDAFIYYVPDQYKNSSYAQRALTVVGNIQIP